MNNLAKLRGTLRGFQIRSEFRRQLSSHASSSSTSSQSAFTYDPLAKVSNLRFDSVFDKNGASVHAVPEGGYVTLNARELDELMPEGLAGEVEDEFAYSRRKAWMIRQPTKILCRLIEKFDGLDETSGNHSWKQASERVEWSGLTDRPEWPQSQLKVRYFGKAIASDASSLATDGVLPSRNSSSDDLVSKLLEESKGVPNKIMLYGKAHKHLSPPQ